MKNIWIKIFCLQYIKILLFILLSATITRQLPMRTQENGAFMSLMKFLNHDMLSLTGILSLDLVSLLGQRSQSLSGMVFIEHLLHFLKLERNINFISPNIVILEKIPCYAKIYYIKNELPYKYAKFDVATYTFLVSSP